MLLCCKKTCHLVKVGFWAMTEVNRWNILSTHSLLGRKVTIICCPLVSSSTWGGGAVYTARNDYFMGGITGFWPLLELRPKPRNSHSCCFCHSVQPILCGVMETSNSNASLTWEMPKALICFTSTFAFSKAACCSDPRCHRCPFLTRQYKGWVPGRQ